jgi:hypothetical protein
MMSSEEPLKQAWFHSRIHPDDETDVKNGQKAAKK